MVEKKEMRDFRGGYEEPAMLEAMAMALEMRLVSPVYRRLVRGLGLAGSERVLEFGTGPGEYAFQLARRLEKGGGELTCVDISKRFNRIARRRLSRFDFIGYCVGSLNEIDLPEEHYDVVVMNFVLHELDKSLRSPAVEILAGALAAGGKLFVAEPTSRNHGIQPGEISRIMEECGLEEVYMKKKKTIAGPVVRCAYEK